MSTAATRSTFKHRLCTCTALVLVGLVATSASAQQISDIGTLGGSSSYSSGMTADASVIFGASSIAGDTETHAFRWENGIMTDLGTLGGPSSFASLASSDGSVIAGYSFMVGNVDMHAFRWENGVMTDLGTLGGSSSYAERISTDGAVIAGTSYLAGDAENHVFRWENGVMADIGTLGGTQSTLVAMSGNGAVLAGHSNLAGDAVTHSFRWENGIITDIGTLGGSTSYTNFMTPDGSVITGTSLLAGNLLSHAYRWENGIMADLGTLGGTFSSPGAISADGSVIAGTSTIAGDAAVRAFRWENGTMADLGTLGGNYAYTILMNFDGSVIAGIGNLVDNVTQHAFRWKNGVMTDMGLASGGYTQAVSKYMSSDGSVITGDLYIVDASRGIFRWEEGDANMRSLEQILADNGVDPGGWSDFNYLAGMTGDGGIMMGGATLNGAPRIFLFNAAGTGGNNGGGEVGVITPEQLAASIAASTAVPAQQAQSSVSGHLGQSLFTARNAMSSYLAGPVRIARKNSSMNFAFHSPADVEPAAGGDIAYDLEQQYNHAFYAVGSFGWGQGSNDFDDTATSGNTGLLFRVADDLAVGVGIIGARSDQETFLGGDSRMDALGGTLMVASEPNSGMRVYGVVTAASLDLDLDRHYNNGGSIASSHGETDGTGFGAALRVGYAVPLTERTEIMPYADLEWSRVSFDGYTETGGPFPANVDDQSGHDIVTRLGAEISHDVTNDFTVRGRAAWGHSYGDEDSIKASAATLSFNLPQGTQDKNWAEGGVTGIWQASDRVSFSIDLSGRTGKTSEPAVNVMTGITVKF